MRRASLLAAFSLMMLIAMSIPVVAADLHPDHVGTRCPDGSVGTWHFVANQVDADEAYIVVTVDGGDTVSGYMEKKGKGQGSFHFWVYDTGTVLDGATTYTDDGTQIDLGGKLVLSEYSCTTPPPCDEKKPEDCKEPEK